MRKWTFKIALATSIRQHALMPNLHVLKVLLKLLSLNPFKITFSQLIPNLREPLHPFSTHSHKPWRLGSPQFEFNEVSNNLPGQQDPFTVGQTLPFPISTMSALGVLPTHWDINGLAALCQRLS